MSASESADMALPINDPASVIKLPASKPQAYPPNPPLDSSFRCTQPDTTFSTARGETVASINIECYIPVGCLRVCRRDTSISPEVWISHSSWSSFAPSNDPTEYSNENTLARDVQVALSEGLSQYGYKPMRKDLCKLRWVRMEFKVNSKDLDRGQVRVFVLPDDLGRINFPRDDSELRKQLWSMLYHMDASPNTFRGAWDPSTHVRYIDDALEWSEEEITKELSLLHIFNNLPSPNPAPHLVKDRYSSEAMRDLLANDVRGLYANLFLFQSKTAAMMIQREAQPSQHLDPRLKVTKDQAGGTWYFNIVDGEWLRQPRFVDDIRGGILAEHMGRGKTLICLALIMATRNHYPDFPIEYSEQTLSQRGKVGSLMEMAAARVATSSIPWKTFFERQLEETGEVYERCLDEIRKKASYYTIKPPQVRESSRRVHTSIPDRKVFRAPTTIVVVPPNLVDQWLNEIEKHTMGLKVLVMKDRKKKVPSPKELVEYDIILFSRSRLENEFLGWNGNRFHHKGCDSFSMGCCDCTNLSPLLDLHFKRIIADEGHFIGNAGGRSASQVVQIIGSLAADSRWVMSGTPTQGLYGVEDNKQFKNRYNGGHVNATENDHKQQRKDVEKIGNICTAFLKSEPWTSEPGSWRKFNMQARYGDTGSFGDPDRLRAIMENTVLRTRAEDVDPEIALPELHTKLVYLDASVQDAIQLNIFVLNIVSNAVTSERQDADYFFHPKNRNPLNELVRNLRQSTFFWSGFTVENVLKIIDIANEYLVEHQTQMLKKDEVLLRTALAVGENILKLICSYPEQRHLLTTPLVERTSPPAVTSIFEAACSTDEIPIYVRNDFPEDVRKAWALDSSDSDPTLFGFTQLKLFSDSAISQLYKQNPMDGLYEVGLKAMENSREPADAKWRKLNQIDKEIPKGGVSASPTARSKMPAKGKKRDPRERSDHSFPLAGGATVGGNISPRKPRRHVLKESNGNIVQKRVAAANTPPWKTGNDSVEPRIKSAMKKTASSAHIPSMDPECKLASAQIESTASAKLSYLITQIIAVKDQEKSIIFYEEETVGYYLAQALEAIGVEHLIYAKAKTLSSALQSRWLRMFADEDNIRVLLMDLGAGTFGLDISCASRVFFVNPVFNPQVEAQAIKRAHRIGQDRPVYVEILVMKGSMEEKIVERRKELSDGDFSGFKSILDDGEMYEWIKSPTFLPLPNAGEGVLSNIPKMDTMAKLQAPHRIFGSLIRSVDEKILIDENEEPRLGVNFTSSSEIPSAISSELEPPKKKQKGVNFASWSEIPSDISPELEPPKKKQKSVGFVSSDGSA